MKKDLQRSRPGAAKGEPPSTPDAPKGATVAFSDDDVQRAAELSTVLGAMKRQATAWDRRRA